MTPEQVDRTINDLFRRMCGPSPSPTTGSGTAGHSTFGTGARKELGGKSRLDLIPPAPLARLAKLYTSGAKKYEGPNGEKGDWNWAKGIPYSECISALTRHLLKFQLQSHDRDSKWEEDHLAAIAFWAFALMEFEMTGRSIDLNDLPRYTISDAKAVFRKLGLS